MQPMRRDGQGKVVVGAGSDPLRSRIIARMNGMSVRAVERLGELMESDDERIAFAASKEILDRRLGRPKQEAEVTVNNVDVTALHLAALRTLSELARPAAEAGALTIEAKAEQ